MEGGLIQYLEGASGGGGGLKMLSKNTCEGVNLIVKLPAISLQAWKFTKNHFMKGCPMGVLGFDGEKRGGGEFREKS